MQKALVGMIATTVLVFTFGASRPIQAHAGESEYDERHESRVKQGLEISPVPLKYNRRDRQMVGWGSYLVNAVGSCNDCHTWPNYANGGDPYQGQPEQINTSVFLAGGRPFGPFTSANITPDATGKPAGLTLDQFRHVLVTGHDPDPSAGGRLLQVMPWPIYRKMVDTDIVAIYKYLKAIPSRPNNYSGN